MIIKESGNEENQYDDADLNQENTPNEGLTEEEIEDEDPVAINAKQRGINRRKRIVNLVGTLENRGHRN